MFKIQKDHTFARDVSIRVPVDDAFEAHSLRTVFRTVDLNDLAKCDLHTLEGQAKYLDLAIARFEQLTDDEGNAVVHSEALKARLIGVPFIRSALMRDYEAAVIEAARKN